MTRNRSFFFLLVFFFVAVIAWASYAMIGGEQEEPPYQVSVIVSDSNNDRWTAMRQGLEQAARDCNVELNYVSTGRLGSPREETALIRRELEGGAQGIIVQMISDQPQEMGREAPFAQVAVVLLESDAGLGGSYAVVGPDNAEIGRAVSEALIRDFGEALSGKKIGILSGGSSGFAMQQRQQGLIDGLREQQAEIVWNVSDTGEEAEGLARMGEVDIMIALDNDGTERMIDAVQAGGDEKPGCALYGVGGSEKAVYYLDKGVIKTLVVPNEFQMGYQSMEAVASQLQYHTESAQNYEVDYLVVDQGNMYDKKNQKLLFPIVQ